MSRLNVVVLEHDARTAIDELGRLGCAQLVPVLDEEHDEMLTSVDVSERQEQASGLLARVHALQHNLGMKPSREGAQDSLPTIEEIEKSLPNIEERDAKIMRQHTALNETLDGLKKQEEEISNIAGLPIEAFNPDLLSFTVVKIGWLPAKGLEEFENELNAFGTLIVAGEQAGKKLVIAVVPRKKRFALQTLLEKHSFNVQQKPAGLRENPSQTLANIHQAIRACDEKLEQSQKTIGEFAESLADFLKRAASRLEIESATLRAMSTFGKTQFCCVANGWVPTRDIPKLKKRLDSITKGRAYIEATPVRHGGGRQKNVPVALTTNRFFKPFKLLVINYGVPAYGEIDPTPFLTISFLVLFGVMFGDVGQGAVLAAIGLALRFRSKKESVRDFGFIFICSGISAIFFGLMLYGSVFGKEGAIGYSPFMIEPLHGGPTGELHLTRLLIAAVALGVIQLSTGIALNIFNRFSAGQYFKGIVDKFGIVGLVLYWGAIGLGVIGGAPIWVIALLIGLPLLLILLAKPLEAIFAKSGDKHEDEGLFMGLMDGAVELIETVISFLANTASFIRVAAFALAHAGLSLAMWTVAEQMSDVPIVPILVLVLGNALTIALEGLIAGIQGIRLIYYEFFGKFFGGDGTPFKPFRTKTTLQERAKRVPPNQ